MTSNRRLGWFATAFVVLLVVSSGATSTAAPKPSPSPSPSPSSTETPTPSPSAEPAPEGELLGVAGVGDQAFVPNPWGCKGRVDNPHESHTTPDFINAYGWIYDCSGVPPSALRRIELWLYRSSYSGWRLVKHNLYKCPERYGQPQCYLGGNMRAVISWDCDVTGKYNYLVEGLMWIDYGGHHYEKYDEKQTGPWDSPGTEQCYA